MSTIEERVKKIVAEQLGVKEEEVTNSASFVEDLGADSLDTVELVMASDFPTWKSRTACKGVRLFFSALPTLVVCRRNPVK